MNKDFVVVLGGLEYVKAFLQTTSFLVGQLVFWDTWNVVDQLVSFFFFLVLLMGTWNVRFEKKKIETKREASAELLARLFS